MANQSDMTRAERAVEYLVESASTIATAKADLVRCENMLRVTKSLAMKHSDEKSAAAQEREAYASDQYRDAIERLAEVAGEYEHLRSLREAAKMRIEYWRSMNASLRGAERGFHSGSAA